MKKLLLLLLILASCSKDEVSSINNPFIGEWINSKEVDIYNTPPYFEVYDETSDECNELSVIEFTSKSLHSKSFRIWTGVESCTLNSEAFYEIAGVEQINDSTYSIKGYQTKSVDYHYDIENPLIKEYDKIIKDPFITLVLVSENTFRIYDSYNGEVDAYRIKNGVKEYAVDEYNEFIRN